VGFVDGLVEVLKGGELGREAAFGGGIDDQDDFSLQAVEGERFALFYERKNAG
jgi:hypothetical protein